MCKFIVTTAFVVLLFSCRPYVKDTVSQPGRLDTVTENGAWGSLKVEFPVYNHAYTDSVIEALVQQRISEFKKYTVDAPISDNWTNELTIGYEEYFADKGIVSIVFKIYQFTGGAHGNSFIQTLTVDSENDKIIYLKDVIEQRNFKKLQQFVRNKLKEDLEFKDFIDDGTERWSDFSSFAISATGYTFWFSPYQVAPYVNGIQKVDVPKSLFKTKEQE